MDRSSFKVQRCSVVTTVSAGLADLARTFQQRRVVVGRITLIRGQQRYEHTITNETSSERLIKAQFRTVDITVACLSPISTELIETLQARTKYAAMAAVDWKETPSQLPFKDPPAQLSLINTSSEQQAKMLGSSKQAQALISDIDRAARSMHVVLILGESGTGKTTAASMIHERSPRARKPFVDVNCAAIPDSLVESELFGHERGAFTGANARKKGLFEMADGGTLFLDEIGDLKLELQAKLLTAIEQQKFRRLGGNTEIKCDVRILVASSRNLQRMVLQGKFREDLYYRLAVLEISIPPLRNRREDIPILVQDRLIYEQQRSGVMDTLKIEDAALRELSTYHWPGNIRELHNVIARLSTCADKGSPITAESARKEIARFNRTSNHSRTRNDESIFLPAECRMLLPGESLQQFIARIKRNVIETVRDCTGSVTAASVRLNFDRSALSKLLTRLKAQDHATEIK